MSLKVIDKKQKSNVRLDWFDAWKGLAILAILLFHAGYDSGSHVRVDGSYFLQALYHPGLWLNLVSSIGNYGTHLFVIIAGAALVYFRRSESKKVFWRRHMVRVIVPYFCAVLLTYAFLYLLAILRSGEFHTSIANEFWFHSRESSVNMIMNWKMILSSIILVPRVFWPVPYYSAPPVSGWFVVLLLQIYLVFPYLHRRLLLWGSPAFIFAMLGVTLVSRGIFLLLFPLGVVNHLFNILLVNRVFELALGMIIGMQLKKIQQPNMWAFLPVGGALLVLGTILTSPWSLVYSTSIIAIGIIFFSIPVAWFFRHISPLRWLGKYSLYIFLSHDLVRYIFSSWPMSAQSWIHWPTMLILFLPSVALVAWGFRYLVQRVNVLLKI